MIKHGTTSALPVSKLLDVVRDVVSPESYDSMSRPCGPA